MAKKRERIFALALALLFLFTTVGVTILVLVQQHGSNNTNSNAQAMVGSKLAGFTPVSHVATLTTQDMSVGSGPGAKPTDTLTLHYNLALASTGIILQSTFDSGQPVPLKLTQVIKGFAQGAPGMKVGGVRRILIPSALAYGANPPPSSGIPPNADLVFDITLLKIN